MQRSQPEWSRSPAALLALALGAGIWWADGRDLWPALLVGAVVPLVLLWRSRHSPSSSPAVLRPLGRWLAVCSFVLLTGAIRFEHAREGRAEWDAARLASADRDITLTGDVMSVRRSATGLVRAVIRRVRIVNRPLPGAVLVYLPEGTPSVRPGMRIRATGRLDRPPTVRNPGQFDYRRYLYRRGVHAILRIRGNIDLVRRAGVFHRLLFAARSRIDHTLERRISSAASRSLLRALLLGDRSGIDPQLQEAFVVTGLVHLLAVSGLHVMIVGLVLYTLSGPFLLRIGLRWSTAEALRVLITLGVLCTYALLVGLPASVVRAVTMAAVLLLGPLFRRRPAPLNSLGLAGLLLLWTQPHALFEPGFQLSFCAVGGLIVLMPPMRHSITVQFGRNVADHPVTVAVVVSTVATLATLPVLLLHFGRASLAGIALNVPAIPLAMLVLLTAVLTVVSAPFPPVSAAFGAAADIASRALVNLAETAADVFASVTLSGRPTATGLLLILLLLVLLAHLGRPGRFPRYLVGVLLAISLIRLHSALSPPTLDVFFLDVGQGDATLVRTPSGKTLLVDAGPASNHFDSGLRIVLPVLRHLRLQRIDALLLTHAHSDHTGGAIALLRTIPTARVLATSFDVPGMREIRRIADSANVTIKTIRRTDTLRLDDNIRAYILGPSRPLLRATNENERSLVLRIVYGSTSVLLPGDVEQLAEFDLLSGAAPLLPSDIIKVAHHGSITSSRPAFVRAVAKVDSSQGWAIISVGRKNRYGLPSTAVLRRWENAGRRTLSTAGEGAIRFSSDGRMFRRVRWRAAID